MRTVQRQGFHLVLVTKKLILGHTTIASTNVQSVERMIRRIKMAKEEIELRRIKAAVVPRRIRTVAGITLRSTREITRHQSVDIGT